MKPVFSQEELKTKKIGIICGGVSAERDVSLDTGKSILAATEELGLNCVLIDAADRLYERLKEEKIEIVFNALHGRYYEDGCTQGLLEMMRIPYTGTGVTGSAVGMDKKLSRLLFIAMNIPMPPGVALSPVAENEPVPALPFEPPVVVKPAGEGSSVGITIIENKNEWEDSFRKSCNFHGDVIVEKYIKGRELQVAYLNDDILGVIEIKPSVKFYDYEAKYLRDDTQYIFPAKIDKEIEEKIHNATKEANRALGCEGVTRSDFIVTESGEIYLLEVNTLPGLSSHSLVPKIVNATGMGFAKLVEILLQTANLKA